jgi:hypothetical protein
MYRVSTKELYSFKISEKRVCNSCATYISHTISHGTTQPSVHLRLVQEIRAERVHLQKQVTLCTKFGTSWMIVSISAVWLAEHISSLCEVCTKLWDFSIDWCRCQGLSTPHLFSVSFWKCKVLLCSPYIKTRSILYITYWRTLVSV